MRTLNIRCNWNELQEIQGRLCESLQKCSNRLHWKTVSFIITHYKESFYFSVQITTDSVLKSERKLFSEVIPLSIQGRQKQEIKSEKPIKKAAPLAAKKKAPDSTPEKESSTELKKEFPKQTKKVHATVSKEKKTSQCNAATQTDFDVGKELSDRTTVLFGPYSLISDWKRSVKCVQVGDGNIQQSK